MNLKERMLHAVLFEVGAILVSTFIVLFVVGSDKAHAAFGVSVAMAVVAMLLNFVFNWGFDKIFTGKREERGVFFRIFHTVTFEACLLLATVPMIAYALDISLWQAFLADIVLSVVITVYAFFFNWAYDHIRLRFVGKEELQAA